MRLFCLAISLLLSIASGSLFWHGANDQVSPVDAVVDNPTQPQLWLILASDEIGFPESRRLPFFEMAYLMAGGNGASRFSRMRVAAVAFNLADRNTTVRMYFREDLAALLNSKHSYLLSGVYEAARNANRSTISSLVAEIDPGAISLLTNKK